MSDSFKNNADQVSLDASDQEIPKAYQNNESRDDNNNPQAKKEQKQTLTVSINDRDGRESYVKDGVDPAVNNGDFRKRKSDEWLQKNNGGVAKTKKQRSFHEENNEVIFIKITNCLMTTLW